DRDGVIIKKVIGAAEWDGPVNELLMRKLIDARLHRTAVRAELGDQARGNLLRCDAVRRRRGAATVVATLRPPAHRHRAPGALGAAAARGGNRHIERQGERNPEAALLPPHDPQDHSRYVLRVDRKSTRL